MKRIAIIDDTPVAQPIADVLFELTPDVAIVGAGAAGLVAALAACEAGAEVVVFERDAVPRGSTALSSGLVPAAGTRLQREADVDDTPESLARDVHAKTRGAVDDAVVQSLARSIGPTIDWLVERHRVPWVLAGGFDYPGHAARRMHGLPSRTGEELMDHLVRAVAEAGIDVLTEARVSALYAEGETVRGLRITRPDGSTEDVGARSLVLACCGFGGNRAMLKKHIPLMADAPFLGHTGNVGDGIRWGEALGGVPADMGAFQGHGSVAIPYNIGISWAVMMAGGIQVNRRGERFAHEHRGYSEQALDVLRQPDGIAYDIYDARCHEVTMGFGHYRDAVEAGAIRVAPTASELAALLGLPEGALERTLAAVERYAEGRATDPLGRDFTTRPKLVPPYYAIKVTGGLYHTQGGLAVDPVGRVRRRSGGTLPNLFAAGGAARGVAGPADWGYLAGVGLLSAIGLGRLAGEAAAVSARR